MHLQVLQQAEKLIPGAAAAVAQSMLRGDAKNDFHDEVRLLCMDCHRQMALLAHLQC